MSKAINLVCIFIFLVFFTSCGRYGYAVNSASNAVQFKQTEDFWKNDGFEFQTILYKSEREQFKIILQHPIYPMREPELLRSQLGIISLDEKPSNARIKVARIVHQDSLKNLVKSRVILNNSEFYAVEYDRKTFPKEARVDAYLLVDINGKELEISFSEDLEWRKWLSSGTILQAM